MAADRDEQLLRAGRMAELGLLTASLTHELRQPLFAIRALAQLAQAQASNEAAEQLTELLAQTDHMERLLETVTRFSRDEEETGGPIDLRGPVRRAVELLRHNARRKGVELALEDYNRLPAIQGDATSLLQVSVNLIQNAVDASGSGQVVRVRMRTGPEAILLEVIDQGPGIPADLRDRIFEPFFTTKEAGKGTGLGLHITRRLVQAHGGELALVDVRRGTHVQVQLRAWEDTGVST